MWDLDTVGVAAEDVTVKEPPVPTWSVSENRYEMGLLWKSDLRPVSNLMVAEARTERMTQKLTDEQFQEYDKHMSKLLEDSILECAPSSPSEFILPHRGLHRNGKLRVVFDGSAPDGTGTSLNSYLEPEENLLRRLPAVLLNFRSGAVGCQTDIRAAFHQITLSEEDRQFVQLLWAGQRLRFRRVPFGLTCSPYMLLCTIAEHVRQYLHAEPVLLQKVQDSIYMDDMCPAFSTRAEADSGLKRMSDVFREASMDLHKTRMSGDDHDDEKVLGLLWSTRSDSLAVIVPQVECPTNRAELLSTVCKPFDPLGVVTPWLIWGKALFQRTWQDVGSSWDSPLSDELQAEVRLWWSSSPKVIWFPRFTGAVECDSDGPVFHVFCDASRTAYCTAVYMVQGGESALVMSKSRLAPLSPHLTIPRLELMAAVIGARLMDFIKNALHLGSATVTYWSDSTDVLHWLNRKKPLKMFVENRVKTVLQLTTADQWRYVRGSENPADLGTRGISLSSLIDSSKWWKGPPFIMSPSVCDVPLASLAPPSTESEAETRTAPVRQVAAVSCDRRSDPEITVGPFDVTQCSHLKQAVNCTAWIRRFAYNARHQPSERRTGALAPDERREALMFWIRVSQSNAYTPKLEALRVGAPLPVDSRLVKVRPQLNADGVLEAVTRTHEPALIILPEFAHITTLVVDDAHRRSFHQGTRTTLALLSGEYSVRRRTVHRVVSTCYRCRRYRGAPFKSADGALPLFRTELSRPFTRVGVDFFGPMYVEGGDKVWILLITCASSRAVHLELCKTQNVADIKLALRRFFALRGTPSLVVSDNARTFHALLGHLPQCVTWRFIPEAAPWWGGFWERLVGVTKKSLRITLHQCHLSFAELAVTLYELALHLNFRPLTPGDNGDLLTPAHLLFGVTSIRGVLSPSSQELDSLDRRWRHQRLVSEHLVRRWTTEYLQTLRTWSVSPRGRPVRLPNVGEVVLVHAEGPRGRWPLARVISLLAGPDGRSRAAIVQIRGRRTRRPISKLFRLEAQV